MADSLVIDTKRPEKFWISYIRGRIERKKNFLGVITGPTGSGKSWSALSLCYQVDPTFTPERIVFSMKELMNLINNGDLKTGSAILWDESGIDISNRSWQSLANKLINFLLQTFRHKRLVLIMTVPYMDFVDSNTRKLFHAEFLTQKIDYSNKSCKVKAQLIQYNPRNKKFYYKYLRIRTRLGVAPLTAWNIEAPPLWLAEEYERLKEKFTLKLNKDIQEQLEPTEQVKEQKPLTEIQSNVLELMEEFGNVKEVAERMKVTPRTIFFHLNQIEKKGYTVNRGGNER